MRKLCKFMVLWVAFMCPQARAHEVLVVAFDSSTLPTMYAGPDGEARGIYPAIVQAAFKRMGVPVRTVALPFRRGVEGLARGEMAVGSLLHTPERDRFASFSKPFFLERVTVYTRRGGGQEFSSLRDLYGKRVGVLRGWAYGEDFDQARAARKFEVTEVDTDDRNFMKLNLGRIDFAIATALAGELLATSRPGLAVEPSRYDLVAAPIHLAINKRSPQVALLARFDAEIAEMRRTGEIDAIAAAELRRAHLVALDRLRAAPTR